MAFSYFVVLNREAETLWICSEFVFRSEICVNVQGRRKKCLYLKWQFHNFMETESIVAHCYHAQWILSDKLIHVWRSPISFSNSNMWCMCAPHIIRHFPSFVLHPLCFSYHVNMRQLKKNTGAFKCCGNLYNSSVRYDLILNWGYSPSLFECNRSKKNYSP